MEHQRTIRGFCAFVLALLGSVAAAGGAKGGTPTFVVGNLNQRLYNKPRVKGFMDAAIGPENMLWITHGSTNTKTKGRYMAVKPGANGLELFYLTIDGKLEPFPEPGKNPTNVLVLGHEGTRVCASTDLVFLHVCDGNGSGYTGKNEETSWYYDVSERKAQIGRARGPNGKVFHSGAKNYDTAMTSDGGLVVVHCDGLKGGWPNILVSTDRGRTLKPVDKVAGPGSRSHQEAFYMACFPVRDVIYCWWQRIDHKFPMFGRVSLVDDKVEVESLAAKYEDVFPQADLQYVKGTKTVTGPETKKFLTPPNGLPGVLLQTSSMGLYYWEEGKLARRVENRYKQKDAYFTHLNETYRFESNGKISRLVGLRVAEKSATPKWELVSTIKFPQPSKSWKRPRRIVPVADGGFYLITTHKQKYLDQGEPQYASAVAYYAPGIALPANRVKKSSRRR